MHCATNAKIFLNNLALFFEIGAKLYIVHQEIISKIYIY